MDSDHAPIPSLLATAGVHHHLIREGTRTRCGLVVESGEPRDIAHLALLMGYGAGAVNPYMVFESMESMIREEYFLTSIDYKTAEYNFIKGAHKGVVKIIAKMGISTIQSYRGAQIFEAVGLDEDFIDEYFAWTPSRIGGIGIEEIEEESRARHSFAYVNLVTPGSMRLDAGGFYQWRRDGEYHMWNPTTIAKLQYATRSNNWSTYQEFADWANDYSQQMCTIRGLLDFKLADEPVALDEVESG